MVPVWKIPALYGDLDCIPGGKSALIPGLHDVVIHATLYSFASWSQDFRSRKQQRRRWRRTFCSFSAPAERWVERTPLLSGRVCAMTCTVPTSRPRLRWVPLPLMLCGSRHRTITGIRSPKAFTLLSHLSRAWINSFPRRSQAAEHQRRVHEGRGPLVPSIPSSRRRKKHRREEGNQAKRHGHENVFLRGVSTVRAKRNSFLQPKESTSKWRNGSKNRVVPT